MRTRNEIASDSVKLLDNATTTGAGDAVRSILLNRTYQVVISSGTATVKLQASLDKANWEDLRTSTASEAFSTSEPWTWVRGNVTAASAPVVDMYMGT